MNEDYVAGFMSKAAELGVDPEVLLCKAGQQEQPAQPATQTNTFTTASGATVSMPPHMMQRLKARQQRDATAKWRADTGLERARAAGHSASAYSYRGSPEYQAKANKLLASARQRTTPLVPRSRSLSGGSSSVRRIGE